MYIEFPLILVLEMLYQIVLVLEKKSGTWIT